jgi:hypothetical protein
LKLYWEIFCNFFILIVHLVEILGILSENFCFIFIPGPGCPDPEWFFPDPTKSFGSDRIRIRNTVCIHRSSDGSAWSHPQQQPGELSPNCSLGVREGRTFLWRIATSPPSYFFGTIHVPYTRVWGAVAANAKKAFQQSHKAKSRRSNASLWFSLCLGSYLFILSLAIDIHSIPENIPYCCANFRVASVVNSGEKEIT